MAGKRRIECAASERAYRPRALGARLASPSDDIFENGQLFRAYWAARMNAPGRNPNLGAHAELAAIRKLR